MGGMCTKKKGARGEWSELDDFEEPPLPKGRADPAKATAAPPPAKSPQKRPSPSRPPQAPVLSPATAHKRKSEKSEKKKPSSRRSHKRQQSHRRRRRTDSTQDETTYEETDKSVQEEESGCEEPLKSPIKENEGEENPTMAEPTVLEPTLIDPDATVIEHPTVMEPDDTNTAKDVVLNNDLRFKLAQILFVDGPVTAVPMGDKLPVGFPALAPCKVKKGPKPKRIIKKSAGTAGGTERGKKKRFLGIFRRGHAGTEGKDGKSRKARRAHRTLSDFLPRVKVPTNGKEESKESKEAKKERRQRRSTDAVPKALPYPSTPPS